MYINLLKSAVTSLTVLDLVNGKKVFYIYIFFFESLFDPLWAEKDSGLVVDGFMHVLQTFMIHSSSNLYTSLKLEYKCAVVLLHIIG